MGGKGGSIPQPRVPDAFSPIMGDMKKLLNMATGASEDILQAFNPKGLGFSTAGGQTALQGLQGFENTLFGPEATAMSRDLFRMGTGNLAQGAMTGFLPQTLGNLDAMLRPALVDRPFDQGLADIFEARALTGTARGSGAVDEAMDLRQRLEENFGQAFAPGATQAALQGQNIQAQSGQQLIGLPQALMGQAAQRLGDILSAGLAGLQGAQGMAGSAANIQQGLPMYQPQQAPGKGAMLGQLAGAAAPIVGGMFGGPMGAMAGQQIGSALSGGGGGGGKGGGGGGGGGGGKGSDVRLKTDITRVGTVNDIPVYTFRYKENPDSLWFGVLAQDILVTHPDAIITNADGYYAVDYDLLGVPFVKLEEEAA